MPPKTSLTAPVLIAALALIVLTAASAFLPVYLPTKLIITVRGPETGPYRVYYDTGRGYQPKKSVTVRYKKSDSFTELAFGLPPREIRRLRIEPGNASGMIEIKDVSIETCRIFRHTWEAEEIGRNLAPLNDIGTFTVRDGAVWIESVGNEPRLETTSAAAIPAVNRLKRVYLYLLSVLLSLLAFFGAVRKDAVISWLSENSRARHLFSSVVLIYLAIITIPPIYRCYSPILDNSWVYAVNYLYDKGMWHDLAWTGGYLEFLLLPMDIGRNFEIALCFQIIIWVVFLSCLIYLLRKEKASVLRIAFFTLLFVNFLIISSIEYFSIYAILMLFLITFTEKKRWYIPFAIGVLLSVIVFFIKYNNGLLLLSTAILLVIIVTLLDYKKGLWMGLVWLASFAASFTVLYLNQYGDFSRIAYFFRCIYEISSGYSAAMSITGDGLVLVAAIGLAAFYLLFLANAFVKERGLFFILLLFSIPLFFAFKHGFVRQDVHSFSFFGMFSAVFSLALLSIKDSNRMTARLLYWFSILILVSSAYASDRQGYNHHLDFLKDTIGLRPSYHRIDKLLHPDIISNEFENSEKNLERLRIPEDWLSAIGEEPIGIFPYMLNYAPANHLRYINFPIIQSYSAYTTLLDTTNSGFLEDSSRAPRFILMHWDAIDGRHPLTEAPAMWISICRWYDIVKDRHDLLLLQRRAVPRFNDLTVLGSKDYDTGDTIMLPRSDHPVFMKTSVELTPYGRIVEILFRIPEVRVTLSSPSPSGTIDMRVIPDTLPGGILVNYLPGDLEGTRSLLSDSRSTNEFSSLRLHGDGLRYYRRDITVEYAIITDMVIEKSDLGAAH